MIIIYPDNFFVAGYFELPAEENERRWHITTPQWPMMQAVTYGVSRDQFMAKHKANHIQVAYAPDAEGANRALAAKAAACPAASAKPITA